MLDSINKHDCKYREVVMYKLSDYNTIWKYSDDLYLAFNSLSGSVLTLSPKIYAALITDKWKRISQKTIDSLVKSYILIPQDVESKDVFYFEMLNVRARKDRVGIFVVPSRLCNLACTYCMQNNLFENKSDSVITKDIIDKYYDWIFNKIMLWDSKRLDIIFYGGEPLTTDITVLQYLIDRFDQLPIKPSYKMITNGTKLLEYQQCLTRMDVIQITLDGNVDVHDKRRVTKNHSGTFKIILHNIIEYLKLSEKNKIVIRMNIDKENRATLLRDIKEITSMLPMDQIEIRLSPVDPYLPGMTDAMVHGDIRETARAMVQAHDFLKRQYDMSPYIWRVNCGVSSICQWSFDTDGSIYKCPALTGDPSRAVCNAASDNFAGSFYKTVAHVTTDEECLRCPHLGLCYGGCMRQEEFSGHKSCKKVFFDEYVKPMIEIKYGLTRRS